MSYRKIEIGNWLRSKNIPFSQCKTVVERTVKVKQYSGPKVYELDDMVSVSYTHLDVYKRQTYYFTSSWQTSTNAQLK